MSAQNPESVRRLAPVDTWPDLRVIVRPLPWTWSLKPRFHADDLYPWSYCVAQWLFLTIEWWAELRPREWFVERAQIKDSGGAA